MEKVLNTIALKAFDLLAARRGFTFQRVAGVQDLAAICQLVDEKTASRPQKGIARFVAYYRGKPVGMAALADLSLAGRAYNSYAVDETGRFFEIQDLAVRGVSETEDRLILLGLFRQMYSWSAARSITYWHCNGARDIYMALRLYSKEIKRVSVDFESVRNPLNQFLVTKRIQEAWFGFDVNNLAPWTVLKKFVTSRSNRVAGKVQEFVSAGRSLRHKLSVGRL